MYWHEPFSQDGRENTIQNRFWKAKHLKAGNDLQLIFCFMYISLFFKEQEKN